MGTNVLCHDDGADHAGTEVTLLGWGDEVFRHGESVGKVRCGCNAGESFVCNESVGRK